MKPASSPAAPPVSSAPSPFASPTSPASNPAAPSVTATSPTASTSPPEADAPSLSAAEAEAFFEELRALRRELEASLGEDDLAHLRKIERLGRGATALGLATCWLGPNPLSMVALSLGRSTRWLLMHHIGHRGYDKVPGVPRRYTSKAFARGARRFVDWPDWMIPEAWIYEHNVLHHSHVGEEKDPDLVERNTAALRASGLPLPARYAAMAALGLTWRWFYYVPTTLRAWLERHDADGRGEGAGYTRALWLRCYAPYAALNFGLLPAAFLPLGPLAACSALVNSLGAEALTNLHTFCVVGPNHTGDDLYRFTERPASKAEAACRQIVGSVNYAVGSDLIDYAHLWLNYQIEHHVWPDLPMLRYREAQPKLQALCAKYGVPYVQEGVFARVKKMVAVAVGKASMKRAASFTRPERAPLAAE
jgi:fatty acid desaturase